MLERPCPEPPMVVLGVRFAYDRAEMHEWAVPMMVLVFIGVAVWVGAKNWRQIREYYHQMEGSNNRNTLTQKANDVRPKPANILPTCRQYGKSAVRSHADAGLAAEENVPLQRMGGGTGNQLRLQFRFERLSYER